MNNSIYIEDLTTETIRDANWMDEIVIPAMEKRGYTLVEYSDGDAGSWEKDGVEYTSYIAGSKIFLE